MVYKSLKGLEIESQLTILDFARKRAAGDMDVTCFHEVQRHWGLNRPDYAPVMFEWERVNRADPKYCLCNLYFQGLLVLDYWHSPVRNFRRGLMRDEASLRPIEHSPSFNKHLHKYTISTMHG